MSRLTFKTLAVACLAFGAHTAQANVICTGCEHAQGAAGTYLGTYDPNTFDVGTFNNTNIALEEGVNTDFTNYWVFDLLDYARGSISADFTRFAPVLNFRGGLYFAGSPTTCGAAPSAPTACSDVTLGAQIGSTASPGAGERDWEIVAGYLAPGRYIVKIEGTTPGSPPSAYSGQLAFIPVPEPATLALLGLGLLGLGVRARRHSA